MNDAHDSGATPIGPDALASRIDAVREVIGLLAIAPGGSHADDESRPPGETFRRLSERLQRLLSLVGMMDCAQAVGTLESASVDPPSADSLRSIDAVLIFIRARLRDVALTGASIAVPAVVARADEVRLPEAAPGSPEQFADSEAVAASARTSESTDESPGDAPPMVDESQFSEKTQAIIRNFKTAPLRQRQPGEITREPRRTAPQDRNMIPEKLKRDCLTEAAGDLADLRTLIASFGKMPGSLDDLRDMAQLGHKVKGTVSTYLFTKLAEVMLCFEGMPKVLQPVAVSRSAACMTLLIRFADVIEAALNDASDLGDATEERLREAEALLTEAQALAAPTDAPATEAVPGGGESPTSASVPVSERITMQLPSVHRVEDDVLRVEPRQLDSLMHQADGLAMNRAMLAQISDEIRDTQSDMDKVLARLASVNAQLGDLHPLIRHASEVGHSGTSGPRWLVRRENGVGSWDDLEMDSYTIFDESLRALSEAVMDVVALSGSLRGYIQQLSRNSDAQRSVLHSMQQTVIHLRLVNLKTLADRVRLAAHQAAETYGKQVEVSISGEDTEIDRNISEGLIAPILQLVRNAIAHGIESPEERVAQGKPATGKVWLRASYSGNEVIIEVGDDGRGVNPHQLIAAALAERILDAKHADYLTNEQALGLMFEPNLSTMDQVGVIAGHGIGLDGVRRAILRLRGVINVLRSEPRRGTVFLMRVPISLSITRAMRVRVGDNEYAIPFASVRRMFEIHEAGILVSLPDAEPRTTAARYRRRVRIARPSPERPLRMPDDPSAALYDETPAFSLAELLGLEEMPQVKHMALLVDVGQREAVVLVDEVLDEAEVVIRALPAHLRRRAVRGASIMADGRLFLVLDLADLIADALGGKSLPRPQPKPKSEEPHQRFPQVLVVEDSISMRRALEGAISGAGYDVRTARDGVEALGLMMAELPDIMVLDIEMPRLDGFELLSVIRGNEALARVPVVILTSRAAEKHYKQAMELGARAYLTKPCPDEILMSHLQRVLRESQKKL